MIHYCHNCADFGWATHFRCGVYWLHPGCSGPSPSTPTAEGWPLSSPLPESPSQHHRFLCTACAPGALKLRGITAKPAVVCYVFLTVPFHQGPASFDVPFLAEQTLWVTSPDRRRHALKSLYCPHYQLVVVTE